MLRPLGYSAGAAAGFNYHLVHQRLAIMDPSASGDQPMRGPGGTSLLTANGEIYNFKELYAELGHPSTVSTSDCEVVLHLWQKLMADGSRSVPQALLELSNKLDGMFAFVLVDEARGTYGACVHHSVAHLLRCRH